ncbi:MAG: efflux RND transporter permease subunit [Gammaproteobacteria bacterium]
MKHIETAVRRPVGTVMIFIALCVIGVISSRLLPLEKWPDIQFPGVFVQVAYPGSTPAEVEQTITRPLEESLATLSGVEEMQSWSNSNEARIFVQFKLGVDAQAKGIEARARVDAARDQLPDDVRNVFVFTGSLSDQSVLALRISSDRDLSQSYDMLDQLLKRRIERVEGVSRVELQGVDPSEIRILMDPGRLSAHGVNAGEVRDALRRANFSMSAGTITDNGTRLSVRPQGEFTEIDQFRRFKIGAGDLTLNDVADVELRIPERNYGRHLDQTYAIGMEIFKSTGANIVEVTDRVLAEVDKVRDSPKLRGVKIFELQNQGNDIRDTLSDLIMSGLIGALLAIVVLYMFLRQLATTLIVTLSVPLSLLITLAALYFFGLSLNVLSMMGMMLAIGMLVDNAVVVTENVFRRRQMDDSRPLETSIKAVNEVGMAVIAGTFTSISVFLPIIFGDQNQITIFLTHVAMAITVAMLASLAISQTLVPMLASRVKIPPPKSASSFMNRLSDAYGRILNGALKRRLMMFVLTALLISSGYAALKMVHFDAFPQEAGRRLYMPYYLNAKYPLETVKDGVVKVEDYLYKNKERLNIDAVYSYYNEEEAQSTLLLKDGDEATKSTKEIIELINAELPEIIIGKPSFKYDDEGGSTGFTLQLSGDSSEQLNINAREVIPLLAQVEGLEDVRLENFEKEQELQVVIDREKAARFGLSPMAVATSISVAMRGENLREFRAKDGEVDVRLAFQDDQQQSIADLAKLPLYTQTGEQIELSSIARFQANYGPQLIRRVNRGTAVIVEANYSEGSSIESVRPGVEHAMASYKLPVGYKWRFGRGFDRSTDAQQQMRVNTLLAVVLIFAVMAAMFESVLYPLSIMVSIALSIVGVYWFFAITGTTFSLMASIGILILIGVVVNNGIVLLDHVNHLRKQGMARNEALVQGGKDRLRPILMTVATTILGLMPLAVGTTQAGGDGPPYFPMARAIIGGLTFATIASLFIVPFVYICVDGLAKWTRKMIRTARSVPLRKPG